MSVSCNEYDLYYSFQYLNIFIVNLILIFIKNNDGVILNLVIFHVHVYFIMSFDNSLLI